MGLFDNFLEDVLRVMTALQQGEDDPPLHLLNAGRIGFHGQQTSVGVERGAACVMPVGCRVAGFAYGDLFEAEFLHQHCSQIVDQLARLRLRDFRQLVARRRLWRAVCMPLVRRAGVGVYAGGDELLAVGQDFNALRFWLRQFVCRYRNARTSLLNGALVRNGMSRFGACPMRVRTTPRPSNQSRTASPSIVAASGLVMSRSIPGVRRLFRPVLVALEAGCPPVVEVFWRSPGLFLPAGQHRPLADQRNAVVSVGGKLRPRFIGNGHPCGHQSWWKKVAAFAPPRLRRQNGMASFMSPACEVSGFAALSFSAWPTTASTGVATQPTRSSRCWNPPTFSFTTGY